VRHLLRLEDPALRVYERDALGAEIEFAREIGGIQNPTSQGCKPINVVERRLS
jgi:hypothetical protein